MRRRSQPHRVVNTVEGSRARATSRVLVTGFSRWAVVTPPNEHPRLSQPGVFVLDKHKRPLMPTSPRRAKQLLRSGRARVHKLNPFTIRLVDRVRAESTVEGVQLKIDPGSRSTGVAVTRTSSGDTVHGLVAIEVQHRGALISRRLTARAGLRRARRSRNLRYRAPRFNNRGRPQGWLAPSLRHRVESTETWVTRLSALAPVTSMSLELARFDQQKITNPEISGTEYQQGTLAGFEAREYLRTKWRRRCAYCDASGVGPGGVRLNIDHVHPRAKGGTDRISNLTLACVSCNRAKGARDVREFVTDPARLARILATAQTPLHDAAAVNSTRLALYHVLVTTGLPVTVGSGAETAWNRTRLGLPKSHTLDALCVGEVAAVGSWPARVLVARSTGRGSYSRTRSDKFGFPRLRLSRHKIHYGFQTGDRVRVTKSSGTYVGRVTISASGYFTIATPAGVIRASHRHCTQLSKADGWTYAQRAEVVMASASGG